METSEETDHATPKGLTRRGFVKWGVAAGVGGTLAGLGVLSALGLVKGPQNAPPDWEVAPGVVDYSKVPEGVLSGPTPNILKVAQWYDYWPGSFITDFETYMKQTYGMDISVQVNIYTSNEELFEWITLGRQSFDVFFPSNYVVDLMKHGNMIYNINPGWVPNIANLDPNFVGVPQGNPFDQRFISGRWEPVSLPYFWGTTGIGYRTNQIPKQDVEANGLDFFWMNAWTPTVSGYPSVQLAGSMQMLDDERDVIGFGLKKAGWEAQKAQGLTPTAAVPPNGPQWTENETDTKRIGSAGDWLSRARPNLFDFNSTTDTSSLIGGAMVLNQVWSGDVMYAKRPDQNIPLPIDYEIPIQGSAWWIDCMAIQNTCRNLWLAHQFFNFVHSVANPWPENQVLTAWNLYSTPNKACYEYFLAHPYPNGWNMAEDPILYPNIYDTAAFQRCDIQGDVGLDALLNEYDPLWFGLTT